MDKGSVLDLPVQALDDGSVVVVLTDPATSDDGSAITVLTDDPATFGGPGRPNHAGCDGDGDRASEGWKITALRARFGGISELADPYYDADRIDWQGRSFANSSIGGSELGTSSSSTRPRCTSTTKWGAVIGCGAPPPPPHELFCARRHAAATAAAADNDEAGFSDEGDNEDEVFPTDAHLAMLRLRRKFKRAEREDEAARGCHTDDKPTTPDFGSDAAEKDTPAAYIAAAAANRGAHVEARARLRKKQGVQNIAAECAKAVADVPARIIEHAAKFDDGTRDIAVVNRRRDVPRVFRARRAHPPLKRPAFKVGVPRDGGRLTGDTRAGSVTSETSVTVNGGAEAPAAFASSLTDPAKSLVDEFRLRPREVSGVCVEEPAAAAEAAPAEAPAEPGSPLAPAMADHSSRQAIDIVIYDDDDNRHPEEEIEGRDGGLWDYAVANDDGELDDDKKGCRLDRDVKIWRHAPNGGPLVSLL